MSEPELTAERYQRTAREIKEMAGRTLMTEQNLPPKTRQNTGSRADHRREALIVYETAQRRRRRLAA